MFFCFIFQYPACAAPCKRVDLLVRLSFHFPGELFSLSAAADVLVL